MNQDPLEAQIQAKLREQAMADAAGIDASAEPFPGPLRDVFALDPDLVVGPYRVRPCYDYDLRVLAMAKHPAYDVLLKADTTKDFLPFGEDAAFMAWMFTQPVEQMEKKIILNGLPACRQEASDQYKFIKPGALGTLVHAVAKQITLSMQARLEFAPNEIESKSEEEANAASPPPKSRAA